MALVGGNVHAFGVHQYLHVVASYRMYQKLRTFALNDDNIRKGSASLSGECVIGGITTQELFKCLSLNFQVTRKDIGVQR